MRGKEKYIFNRVLWMLMALHILNFSIDNPHTLFEHNKVDTDFNEIDSVVELVLEDVMNIDDAIPEHHSKTPITHKFSAKKIMWMFDHKQPVLFTKKPIVLNFKPAVTSALYAAQIYNSPLLNLFSPPPEA